MPTTEIRTAFDGICIGAKDYSLCACRPCFITACVLCVCVCFFSSGIMGQFLGASETIVRATAK